MNPTRLIAPHTSLLRKIGSQMGKGLRILAWRLRHHSLWIVFTWAWTRVYLWTVGRPVLRYCPITPQLYVGGQFNARGWRWLAAHGLTADVNMRSEFDDAAHGIAPEAYLWLPTPDDHAPTLDQLHTGVAFIRRVIEQGGKVYVHCGSGVGRAPTMAAAYLVSTGLSVDQAWALIRKTRPFVKPTRPQLATLEQFAAETGSRKTGESNAPTLSGSWATGEKF